MPTSPDPRWDEAAIKIVIKQLLDDGWTCEYHYEPDAECSQCQRSHRDTAENILAALADAGRLLTPQMAEVLERARAVADAVRHTSALTGSPPHPMSWRAEILAAVDAWEASREH